MGIARQALRRLAIITAAVLCLSANSGCATVAHRVIDTSCQLLEIKQRLVLEAGRAAAHVVADTAMDLGKAGAREVAVASQSRRRRR